MNYRNSLSFSGKKMRATFTLLLFVLCGLFHHSAVMAQDEEKDFGISFKGFVKNDFFFDSRQTVAAREGHFLLWPSAEMPDVNGEDINAVPNFNFLAVQSRLSGKITGPDVLGAKTSGLIEGDFFAQANDNINLFRLRHAFIKLDWGNTQLLTGQYWNPLFVTGCFPGTVSFNTGTPFQSFARNPQIRLTQKMGSLSLIVAALAQRDYTSRGVDGPSSSYLRNALLPDAHFQIQYKQDAFLAGVGVAYKTIVPRLYSDMGTAEYYTGTVNAGNVTITKVDATSVKYKVDEKVSGLTAIAFAKLSLKPVTIKLQGRYGENIADVLSISGFAVKEVVNATTGEQSYTPLTNTTVWGEIHTNGGNVEYGLFGGILLNTGTKEAMSDAANPVYGLATNIETLIRISPRVVYKVNKFKFACELEYTAADYGSGYDINYVPASTTKVANTRVLLSTIYSF